jgi:dTDP-4-dehydrorhamnose 3,5-epimerase
MAQADGIDGVRIRSVQDLSDARGSLQHMIRSDDTEFFAGFGEIYFSITNPGVIKGWHRQRQQTNLLSCIKGRLRLVLFDDRDASPSRGQVQVVDCGDGARRLVRIPPGVVYGWQTLGDEPSILANCSSHPHDPATAEKIDPASGRVPYAW